MRSFRFTHLAATAALSAAMTLTAQHALSGTSTSVRAEPAGPADVRAPADVRLPAAATVSGTCGTKTLRRTIVLYDATRRWGSTLPSKTQQITTTKSQGDETLVITYTATVALHDPLDEMYAWVYVDGKAVEPVHDGPVYRGDSTGTVVVTRCLRVRPGKHHVRVDVADVSDAGSVEWYTLRIEQYS